MRAFMAMSVLLFVLFSAAFVYLQKNSIVQAATGNLNVGNTSGTVNYAGNAVFQGADASGGTGAVTCTNGSPTVTGINGTLFTTEVIVGDWIKCGSQRKPVTSVQSNTSLTVSSNYTATVTNPGTSNYIMHPIARFKDYTGTTKYIVDPGGNFGAPGGNFDVGNSGVLTEGGVALSSKYAYVGGGNATGSWGIDISGNAATASNALQWDGGSSNLTAATGRTSLGLGSLATLSAVGSAQITDGSVASADIADGTITGSDLSSSATPSITSLTLSGALDVGTSQIFRQRGAMEGNGASCSAPADGSAGWWYADAGDCTTVFAGINTTTNGSESWGVYIGGWRWYVDVAGKETATTVNATSAYQLNGTQIVDSSRNLANIGTIGSGAITSTSTVTGTTINGTTGINTGAGAGTQRINSSGNLVNIGTISLSGAITSSSATGANITTSAQGTGLTVENAPGAQVNAGNIYLKNSTNLTGWQITNRAGDSNALEYFYFNGSTWDSIKAKLDTSANFTVYGSLIPSGGISCTGCVDSTDIADGTVSSTDILDGTIVAGDIAANIITGNKIAGDAIGDSELFNGGTWNLSSQLTIGNYSAGTTAPFRVKNNTTGNMDVMHLLGGSTTATNGMNYIMFCNPSDSCFASIDGNGTNIVRYNTSGTDYAEYFRSNPGNIEKKYLISMKKDGSVGLSSAGEQIIGVVSSHAGFVGGNGGTDKDEEERKKTHTLVGLVGQIPTFVSGENGPIHAGDKIAASDIPGVGVKAISAGFIVGQAQEDFIPSSPDDKGTISVLVQPSWYSPDKEKSEQDKKVNDLQKQINELKKQIQELKETIK